MCTSKEAFDIEDHIESARLVDVGTVRVNRVIDGKELTRMRPTAGQFQACLRRLGINNDSKVVITQRGQTPAKGTQRYFEPKRLQRIITDLNIDPNNELILFCNSAFECSSDWFALHEILGKPRARIYDGSLHQWTQYEDNPMATRVRF